MFMHWLIQNDFIYCKFWNKLDMSMSKFVIFDEVFQISAKVGLLNESSKWGHFLVDALGFVSEVIPIK